MEPARSAAILVLGWLALGAGPLSAQSRPDFSGVWRLDPAESRMVGPGGRSGPARLGERQITWLIDHRDPEISVVIDVRDPGESQEFSFRCTTDGRTCLNELPVIGEVRRLSAVWEREVLVITQQAQTPHGNFAARDRVSLSASGDRLVFERVVRGERGERSVRQVFRKVGPHPSRRPDAPARLPTIALPPELERILRDYERHWRAGDAGALAALFTDDGFVANRGGWIRGRGAIRDAYGRTSSALRLRAVSYAAEGRTGYIIGAYGYGAEPAVPDRGMFILALRKDADGRWLIAADLDGSIRP